MKIAFAVIAITLLSLSSCDLFESLTSNELEDVLASSIEMHKKNFPEDHRFDGVAANIDNFPKATVYRQINILASVDSGVYDLVFRNILLGQKLDSLNPSNVATIALFCFDYSSNGRLLGAKHNLRDGKLLRGSQAAIIDGMTKEEMIVIILKECSDFTTKDLEDILSKPGDSDIRAMLEKEDVHTLVQVDHAIQQYYFGEIRQNVEHLNKQEVLEDIFDYLDMFPELEIFGVLSKISKLYN